MSTFLKLKAQLARLDHDIAAAREAELNGAIETCRELIEAFGLTAHDLGLIRTQVIRPQRNGAHTFPLKTKSGPKPPRYRNPDTGETWSGYGRMPHWITDEDRDDFLINDQPQARAA